MKKLEIWTIVTVFIALISIPVIVFAAGGRPEPNQNRPPTPLPDISVAGVLDRELTPQLDAYLEDALIIAPGAVAAEAWADVALGDNPSEEVTLGTNGWLYYTFALTRPCLSPEQVAQFADTLTRAERVVAATGRRLIVAIAPDKASIIPDFLPNEENCVDETAAVIGELDAPDALLTVWDEMRTARANDRPIYFRLDTHWTNAGAAVMAEAIIERLRPEAWNPEAVRELREYEHEGDLTVLLGLPSTEPAVELEVQLQGSTQTRETRSLFTAAGTEYDRVVAVDFAATEGAVIGDQTLIMHDSYGWALTPMLSPYFANASFVAETDPSVGHLQHDLRSARTIVHLSVQRSLHEVILGRDLAAGFVSAFADEFETLESGVRETGERLELEPTFDGYLIVEITAGLDAAEVAYNDVTAVLNPESPRAAFHIGAGGTVYFAGEVDYRLVTVGG